jgi:hypothetical protein
MHPERHLAASVDVAEIKSMSRHLHLEEINMHEMTFAQPIELSDEQLDLVAAGTYSKSNDCGQCHGTLLNVEDNTVQVNGVNIFGNQQNANNGGSNKGFVIL